MVFKGPGDEPAVLAFAPEDYDRGDTIFCLLFAFKEALLPGDMTLTCGDVAVTVTLPEGAVRQPSPGHLYRQSVRKVRNA